MAAPLYYSVEMIHALPDDGKRYETVHGELLVTDFVSMWHQAVLGRVMSKLGEYVDAYRCGHLFLGPADISWGPDILVKPDLLVVDLAEARTMDWAQMKTLSLVVEITGPSTSRYDRYTKRRLYQEVGIPFYWIVDPDEKLVEVWKPEDQFPTVERKRVTWKPEGADEEFVLELEELFKPI
jgi:Uma2 family endonuclease